MTKRTILFDKPRVTKFNIKWDDELVMGSLVEREDKMTIESNKVGEEES